MTLEKLMELADKYQAKADQAYRNYQDTGMTRYDRERRNNEDLADAMRMAANAKPDHEKVIHLKADLANLAVMAKRIASLPEDEQKDALERLRSSVIATANVRGVMTCDY